MHIQFLSLDVAPLHLITHAIYVRRLISLFDFLKSTSNFITDHFYGEQILKGLLQMRKVEVSSIIQTTPDRIISAFTEPEMLREWWAVERTLIDNKKGGLYTLAWNISDKGFGFISTGIIEEYNPANTLVIENFVYLNPDKPFFGPMKLTVKAEPKGNGSVLYLCQDGYQSGAHWDWYYDVVKQAWPAVVLTLKEYLEKSQDVN
jgi:uncharacterized protein YndB with AHSA1/START domain